MGIDFAGGLSMTIALETPVEVDRIRQALSAKGVKEAQIQQLQAAKGQRLLIKLREVSEEATVKTVINDLAGATGPAVTAAVAGKAGKTPAPAATGNKVVVEGTQAVGPAVGRLLQQKAAWAAFWAIVMITVYIWWRFEYRFGVAAAIATAHDVFAVMGIMWLLQKDFTLLTVSALLTIAGYSLTDTVVVYDRIRENMRLRAKDSLEGLINVSVNEVLSRTTMTSLTTLMPLVALLIYGSQVTYDFSLALTMGIFIGTYSSWYVASPIIVEWENYKRRKSMESAVSRQQKR
jgi:preprotein translocase subunit SecF